MMMVMGPPAGVNALMRRQCIALRSIRKAIHKIATWWPVTVKWVITNML